jgi:hypothetical protein
MSKQYLLEKERNFLRRQILPRRAASAAESGGTDSFHGAIFLAELMDLEAKSWYKNLVAHSWSTALS